MKEKEEQDLARVDMQCASDTCRTAPAACGVVSHDRHSPLPWRAKGRFIVTAGPPVRGIAEVGLPAVFNRPMVDDAAFIVRCVNAHAALVEALRTFGSHHGDCAIRQWDKGQASDCSCGFSAALAAVAEQP